MGKLNALLLAGTVAFGAAGSVYAADLPAPPPLEAMPVEPVDFGGWYLRGDVGVGIASKPEIRSSFDAGAIVPNPRFDQEHLGDAAFVGGGIGYQFNHWFRADLTGEYRTSQDIKATESYDAAGQFAGLRGFDAYTGSVQSSVFLANAYFDIGTWYGITPFIGAGVGGAYNRIFGLTDYGQGGFNEGVGFAHESDKFNLAYAAHAGVSYAVSPNLKLELAYRYLNMGDATSNQIICQNGAGSGCPHEVQKYKLESQDIKLGMRWMFTDVAPIEPVVYAPPPQAPLVRKY